MFQKWEGTAFWNYGIWCDDPRSDHYPLMPMMYVTEGLVLAPIQEPSQAIIWKFLE